MKAIRHYDVIDTDQLDINSNHLNHMYSGRFSWYYYRRFDMILEQANLDSADNALILGGGTGVFTMSILNVFDDIHFIDITPEYFSDADSLFSAAEVDSSSVNFITADGTNMPLADDSVDVAFALDTLEHIPGESDAISELDRVLRPDGQLLISAPVEIGPPRAVRELYRFADGQRQSSESISELFRSVIGRPSEVDPYGHQGYDYRETVNYCRELFDQVDVSYCPLSVVKWFNPTVIITAQ